MEPEGLIFDCDGTLVDTMPIHFKAWSSTTKVHGLVFPEDRFYALGGVSPFEVLRILSSEQGVKVDPEAVTREKESRYMELIAEADEIPEVMQIVRENTVRSEVGDDLLLDMEEEIIRAAHVEEIH